MAAGLRLASLFGTDEGEGGFAVHHLWASTEPPGFVRVWAPVARDVPRFPSIAAKYPVANWFEREVMDYFGLVPEGHPNRSRVALHDDWPEDVWPLRKDFDDRQVVPRVAGQARPVSAGDGRGRVPGPGRTGPRGRHRAGSLPVRRGGGADPLPASPAVLHPQGHREALRAAALAARPLPRGIDLRRHGGGARPGLRARDRAPRRGRAAARGRDTCASSSSSSSGVYNHVADIGGHRHRRGLHGPRGRAQILREGLVTHAGAPVRAHARCAAPSPSGA